MVFTREFLQRQKRILNTLIDDTFDEDSWIREWQKWANERTRLDD